MKISISSTRSDGTAAESTSVQVEHDGLYSGATAFALALLAGVRFEDGQIRNLLGYEKLHLQAGAEDEETEESRQTRETLLAQLPLFKHAEIEIDENGVIQSINASLAAETEEDRENAAAVLESLEASGTPHTLVGDLAQTSIVGQSGQEQVLALAEWSIAWKRKTVETTNTDNALYETSLGSTKSWTAKAKYMFLVGDTSQSDAILSAVDTTSLVPLTWNFFPNVNTGDPAFQGAAIVDGIDISSGSGKIVGLDVSLKGTGPLLRKVQAAPVANPNTVTGQTAQV